MQKIFYIDVDEEVSSIIEKLHKSSSEENYFVINGRSLMAQSVVNMKLLKREAEKIQKRVIIVTQDEQVMKMANRSGIEFRKSVEDIEGAVAAGLEESKDAYETSDDDEDAKKARLGNVGSENFYGDMHISGDYSSGGVSENTGALKNIQTEKNIASIEKRIPVVEEIDGRRGVRKTATPRTATMSGIPPSDTGKIKKEMSDFVDMSRPQASDISRKAAPASRRNVGMESYDINKSFEEFLDPEKEKRFERILSRQMEKLPEKKIEEEKDFKKVPSGGGWGFAIFLVVILLVAVVAGYLYIPSADVKVYLEKQDKNIDTRIKLDVSREESDISQELIAAKVVESEDSIMLSYDSTGTSDSSGQKAKGVLVIYNEYGPSPQPLVATTRFETEDGKIFRLVKGVTVPGVTNVGGEKKPGAIEAEVIADEVGSEYNIGATSFNIPGFKGGDKYEKIYAKSSSSMAGGGVSGDAVRTVSQSDIDSAKSKTEEALKGKMVDAIKARIGDGEVVISKGENIAVSESLALAMVGDVKSTFDYQAKAKGKFFVVREDDVRKIIEKRYGLDNKKDFEISISSIDLSYGNVEANFDAGEGSASVSAHVFAEPVFSADAFKKSILGEDEEGIRGVLIKYPYIRNLEISASPEFMASKLPRLESRIKVDIIKQ